jgi:hypothetical protein
MANFDSIILWMNTISTTRKQIWKFAQILKLFFNGLWFQIDFYHF